MILSVLAESHSIYFSELHGISPSVKNSTFQNPKRCRLDGLLSVLSRLNIESAQLSNHALLELIKNIQKYEVSRKFLLIIYIY
jgi:hypothetical protein